MADLDLAKKRFRLCQEAESSQRSREIADLRFQVPEFQWDETAKRERMGNIQSNIPVPPRPTLSIDKLQQPIQLIQNQARAANLGVNIHPVSEDADDETAEVMQGLYRRIERDSNASQARLWALDRAVKAGRGYYRITTAWDEDSDPRYMDQEIRIERILYQENVYFDPSATNADYSDAEYCFVVKWISIDEFRRRFPDADLANVENGDNLAWEAVETSAPEWVRMNDDGTRAVLVAEHWYKEHKSETIKAGKRSRELDLVTVHVCEITGSEILAEQEWSGHHIPVVAVIGRELQPFDSERRWVGMIGPARDGQKFYNYAASNLVERMALEPKAPFIGVEGQFEGHEAEWQQANIRNFPYLEYKPTSIGDQPAPPPQRATIDQSGMSLSMMAMQEADRFIQAATSVYDPSLGRESSRDKSGKAIVALQQQSDAGTSHFLASLADISMPYEAKVILDLIPAIYDRPGRITTILKGEEDKVEPVMLNQPYTTDQDGRPQPAGMMDRMMRRPVQEFNLSSGKYAVSVDVGKSFQTRLQQGADEIGQLLASAPDLLPIIGDIYFRFRDFPGAAAIADRLVKMREQTHPGLGEEQQGKPDVAALQAQMQQMQQQGQQMQQQLQEAMKAIEGELVQQRAETERVRMDIESRERIAAMNNETKLAVEGLKDEKDQVENAFDRQHEANRDHEEMAHETGLAAMSAAAGRELAKRNTELREPPKGGGAR